MCGSGMDSTWCLSYVSLKLNVLKFTFCLTNLLDLLLVYKKIKKYFIKLSKWIHHQKDIWGQYSILLYDGHKLRCYNKENMSLQIYVFQCICILWYWRVCKSTYWPIVTSLSLFNFAEEYVQTLITFLSLGPQKRYWYFPNAI